MQELADSFIDWLRLRRSDNTIRAYRDALKIFVEFTTARGIQTPDQVTFLMIEDFMSHLHRLGNSARTINHRLAALRMFWKWMRRAGHAANNPAGDVEGLKTKKRLPVYLSIEQQEKLLAAIAATPGTAARRDEAVIITALMTGMRCDELAGLRTEHIDLPAGSIRVVDGKGGKDREIEIVPRLAAALTAYLPIRAQLLRGTPSPWFFVSAHPVHRKPVGPAEAADAAAGRPRRRVARRIGERLGRISVYAVVTRATEKHLGRKFWPHVLRHSFATRLRENGADIQLIQECLGHADIGTTTIYASLSNRRRRELLHQFLSDGAPTPTPATPPTPAMPAGTAAAAAQPG